MVRTEKTKQNTANKRLEQDKQIEEIKLKIVQDKFQYDEEMQKIEKNKVVVNYGVFTSKVNIDLLEFVERPKS